MSRRSRVTHRPLTVKPYGWKVYIAVGEEELQEFYKLTEEADGDNINKYMGFHVVYQDANEVPFSLIYFDKDETTLLTVVHEVVHCIHYMMESKGIPLTYENTEILAHHIEDLVELVLSEFKVRGVELAGV